MSRRRKKQKLQPQPIQTARRSLDLTAEALQLVRSGRTAALELRMLGGTAIMAKCTAAQDLLERHKVSPKDIDLAALGHQRRRVRDFLYGQGWRQPDSDLLHPYTERDVFVIKRPEGEMRVEVFFDELHFIHPISFAGDFARLFPTLPLDTLVMSKLQMRTRFFIDWLHLAALLIQSKVEADSQQTFDSRRLTRQSESDYRCWRDFQNALKELPERSAALRLTDEEALMMSGGIELVKAALDMAKHGPRWALGRIKAFMNIEPPEPE